MERRLLWRALVPVLLLARRTAAQACATTNSYDAAVGTNAYAAGAGSCATALGSGMSCAAGFAPSNAQFYGFCDLTCGFNYYDSAMGNSPGTAGSCASLISEGTHSCAGDFAAGQVRFEPLSPSLLCTFWANFLRLLD